MPLNNLRDLYTWVIHVSIGLVLFAVALFWFYCLYQLGRMGT